MRICGVIAEYNPFHNGHALQLGQARRLSGCDRIVVCMNGSISQRGEVMLEDKWTRTRDALTHGADVVIELPAMLAVRPADRFAHAGVGLLGALKVDALSFGCETDDGALLAAIARRLDEQTDGMAGDIRRGLDEGKSLARARADAVERALDLPAGFTKQPNLILGIEYLRAIQRLDPAMSVFIVRRTNAYQAGASALRAAVTRQEWSALDKAMPDDARDRLLSAHQSGICAFDFSLDQALIHQIRSQTPERLNGILGADEGLENLIKKQAEICGSREALIQACVSRRYTSARISRLCASLLINLTKDDARRYDAPRYARVLGFRRDATDTLRVLQGRSSLPLITDPVRLKDDPQFAFDRAATDLRSLAQISPENRQAGTDFTHPIVIV